MSDDSRSSLNHEEAYAQLGALALGALDPAEEQSVLMHAEGCAECSAELAVMREVAAGMPENPSGGVMEPERSRAIRASLVERAGRSATSAPPVNYWRTFSIAATIAIAALGTALYREYSERAALSNAVAARAAVTDSLERVLREKTDQLAAITGRDVRVVELSSSGVRAPSARMFWDRATNRWTIYAHGLSQLAPGRAYELWLVTADTKIPAGTFKPASDGTATFTATYTLAPLELKAIAVTEEPESGVPAPTGPIVLLGTADAI